MPTVKMKRPRCIRVMAAAFAVAFCGATYGQSERCPIVAKLPADLKDSASIEDRLWFELRQCNGETVTVNAYERQKTKPTLTFNTGYIYPSFLAHTFNILVLESFGGSANHVTVIVFQKGKPTVALDRSAVAMQIKRAETEIILTITPKTYPGPDGKFPTALDSVYRFQLEL